METAIYSTLGLLFLAVLYGVWALATEHPVTYIKFSIYPICGLGGFAFLALGFTAGARYGLMIAAEPFYRKDAVSSAHAFADRIDGISLILALVCFVIAGYIGLMIRIAGDIHKNKRSEQHKETDGR